MSSQEDILVKLDAVGVSLNPTLLLVVFALWQRPCDVAWDAVPEQLWISWLLVKPLSWEHQGFNVSCKFTYHWTCILLSQNLSLRSACWYEKFHCFVPKFSPFLGLIFPPFFCPPVGVESVSKRANPTLLFITSFWIHFLPLLSIEVDRTCRLKNRGVSCKITTTCLIANICGFVYVF